MGVLIIVLILGPGKFVETTSIMTNFIMFMQRTCPYGSLKPINT